jgi:hypothetical protein
VQQYGKISEHALHIVECSASPDPSSVTDLQQKIKDGK